MNAKSACSKHRFRMFEGKAFDMEPVFEWFRTGYNMPGDRDGEFHCIVGKISQVLDDNSVLVISWPSHLPHNGESETVLVRNYPWISVDEDPVLLIAKAAGRFKYSTIFGAAKTVAAYDYGRLPDAKLIAILEAEANTKQKAAREKRAISDAQYEKELREETARQARELAERQRIAAERKKAEQDAAVAEFRLQQANRP